MIKTITKQLLLFVLLLMLTITSVSAFPLLKTINAGDYITSVSYKDQGDDFAVGKVDVEGYDVVIYDVLNNYSELDGAAFVGVTINALDYSSSQLAIGRQDNYITLKGSSTYNTVNGIVIGGPVRDVEYSHDSTMLAVASDYNAGNEVLTILNPSTGGIIYQTTIGTSNGVAVSFSEDDTQLAIATTTNLYIYNTSSWTSTTETTVFNTIKDVFFYNSTTVAVAGQYVAVEETTIQAVILYDFTTNTELERIDSSTGTPKHLSINSYYNRLAFITSSYAYVYNTYDWSLNESISVPSVSAITYNNDGTRLAISKETGYVYIYNSTTPIPGPPELDNPTNLTVRFTTAILQGEVLDEGNLVVTDRGFLYSTNISNVFDDLNISSGNGLGLYNATLTNLTENTTYYYTAFATNSNSTVYTDIYNFTTLTVDAPIINDVNLTNINYSTVDATTTIAYEGNVVILNNGFVYSTTINPTLADFNSSGSLVENITGLDSSTTYYIRAYLSTDAGIFYSNETNFTTLTFVKPTLGSLVLTDLSYTSINATSQVTSEGDGEVTDRGFVYDTSSNPTTSDTKVSSGTGNGQFSEILTLDEGTTYYIKSYATNVGGTTYSAEQSFTTLAIIDPTFSNITVSNVNESSATLDITYTVGTYTVTEKGFVYSTSSGPTTSDTKVIITTPFSTTLNDLTGGETYYVRAYAINEEGTFYSNEVPFTVLGNLPEFYIYMDGNYDDAVILSNYMIPSVGVVNLNNVTITNYSMQRYDNGWIPMTTYLVEDSDINPFFHYYVYYSNYTTTPNTRARFRFVISTDSGYSDYVVWDDTYTSPYNDLNGSIDYNVNEVRFSSVTLDVNVNATNGFLYLEYRKTGDSNWIKKSIQQVEEPYNLTYELLNLQTNTNYQYRFYIFDVEEQSYLTQVGGSIDSFTTLIKPEDTGIDMTGFLAIFHSGSAKQRAIVGWGMIIVVMFVTFMLVKKIDEDSALVASLIAGALIFLLVTLLGLLSVAWLITILVLSVLAIVLKIAVGR